MYSPTTRLLTVLELLQARRQLTGAELAERLEVDGRTVRRYITMLQDMGVPVEATRGRYGAYRLRSGFNLPPLLFTDDEAQAVAMGLLVARSMGLTGDPAAVEGALAKIERVLPADLREQVRAMSDTLVLDVPVSAPVTAEDAVPILSRAVQGCTSVWLRHQGRDGDRPTERVVDPYGLVYRNGTTYLAGYCHLREDVRVFRLDRVLSVEPRDGVFERPAGFDPLEHVLRTLATTPREWQVEALLKTSLDHARRRVPAGVATLAETPDGVMLRCHTEDLDWFARVLLWLRCPLVVQQPPELRDALARLADEAEEMARGGC